MNILIAILWGLVGWSLRVIYTYWLYSKDIEANHRGKFNWNKFIVKYDQDWIMGFAAMVVFASIADWAWVAFISNLILSRETLYDPKANVIIGFLSILLVEKLAGHDK